MAPRLNKYYMVIIPELLLSAHGTPSATQKRYMVLFTKLPSSTRTDNFSEGIITTFSKIGNFSTRPSLDLLAPLQVKGHNHFFLIFRSKQVVHLETRIQFDLGSDEIKSGNHAAVDGHGTPRVPDGEKKPGGQECLLTNGEMATCMDFIACQKYTGIGLSDKLGIMLQIWCP